MLASARVALASPLLNFRESTSGDGTRAEGLASYTSLVPVVCIAGRGVETERREVLVWYRVPTSPIDGFGLPKEPTGLQVTPVSWELTRYG